MSQKVRIGYKNYWRDGTIIAQSSEHPQFPSENTQDDDKALHWRSRHGSGSGNGRFAIGATNKYIDFDEGGAELTATLTEGNYNGQTLATEIKTRMDAAGGTYTVTYSESTGKFTIARTGNFTLRWQSGTNTANTVGGTIGFIITADDTGAETYTSDYMRIHTSEYIAVDLGSALEYDFVCLLNHNLQSGATITFYGADDSAFTSNVVSDTLTYYGNNLFKFLSAARTKRYVRIYVVDVDNPSGYVKIGTIVVCKYIEFARYPKPSGYWKGEDNPSLVDLSDSQNLFADDKPRLFKRSYPFEGLSNTDASNIIAMQTECGDHKGIVVCIDPDNPNTASEWVTLAELSEVAYQHVNYWNWTMAVREHK